MKVIVPLVLVLVAALAFAGVVSAKTPQVTVNFSASPARVRNTGTRLVARSTISR